MVYSFISSKTDSRLLSKKAKYTTVAVACGIMIAIIIVIATVVPTTTISKSKSSTTQSTMSTPSFYSSTIPYQE